MHSIPRFFPCAAMSTVACAVVAPLTIGAGTASAKPIAVWERVAQCESGGNWGTNTGNGFYGGLQFTLQTWRAFGGKGMPNKASKAEQIRVGEATLKGQGAGAWPVCGKFLG